MSEISLESYFNFDQADLEANRRGQLTQQQVSRLENSENPTRLISAVIAVAAVLLTLIPLVVILSHLFTASLDQVGMGLVLWTLIAGIVSFFAIRRSLEKGHDFTVRKIEGPIQIRTEKSAGGESDLDYFLHIQGEVFDVDGELTDFMEPGDVLVIYYLADPHTHLLGEILSVELIV
jgi:hypothetical protein